MWIVSRETERDFFMRKCKVDGCDKKHYGKGFCIKHYTRFNRYGDPEVVNKKKPFRTGCIVDGCDKKHYAKGYCRKCYEGWLRRKRGSPQRESANERCNKCGNPLAVANDMCQSCYDEHYYKNHRETINMKNRSRKEKRSFGGRRNEILQAYRYKCVLCDMSDNDSVGTWGARLEIHHKDGNNMNSDTPNHNTENLMVLCKRCHASLHHKQGVKKCV